MSEVVDIVHQLIPLFMHSLKNDASSVLRTCGWLEEVYSFMRLKKRSYASQLKNTSETADYLKWVLSLSLSHSLELVSWNEQRELPHTVAM